MSLFLEAEALVNEAPVSWPEKRRSLALELARRPAGGPSGGSPSPRSWWLALNHRLAAFLEGGAVRRWQNWPGA